MKAPVDDFDLVEMRCTVDDLKNLFDVVVGEFHGGLVGAAFDDCEERNGANADPSE